MKTSIKTIMRTCRRAAASLVMAAAACGALAAHAAPVDASAATDIRFVQYVQATAGQYVDTGVIGGSGIKAEMAFSGLDYYNGGISLIGSESASGKFYLLQDNTWPYLAYNTAGEKSWCYKAKITRSAYNVVSFEVIEGVSITYAFNGSAGWYGGYDPNSNPSANIPAFSTGLNMYLFAKNNQGTAQNLCKATLYYAKIWQDGKLVRNFFPCVATVDGVERAGLYDSESGKIYFSESGTDLVAADTTTTPHKPDAYLEYVQSAGNAYIDTGVAGKSGTKVTADFTMGSSPTQMLLGSRTSDANRFTWGVEKANNSYFTFYYLPLGNNTLSRWTQNWLIYWGNNFALTSEVTTDGTVSMSWNGNTGNLWEWNTWNDSFLPNNLGASDTKLSMYLFAENYKGSPVSYSTATLRSMTIEQWDATANDYVTVRDFVPCKKNGTAALYDKVSKSIFYPVGTLTAGPVVKGTRFVEYVESNGSQYVDTGITGRYGTAIEADFAGCAANYATLVGAQKEPGNYKECVMWQGYGSWMWLIYRDSSVYWYSDKQKAMGLDRRYKFLSSVSQETRLSLSIDGVPYTYLPYYGGTTQPNPSNIGFKTDTGYPMYVFAANVAGTASMYSSARLYGLRIWQDGALVRDFRPCIDCDDTPALYDMVSQSLFHSVGGDALTASDVEVPARAVWKGGAVTSASDLANAANWTCTDITGNEIAGAVPGSATTIVISSATDPLLSLPSGVSLPSHAIVEVTGSMALAADADWTHLGSFAFANGASIDLAGHNLTLSAFSVKTAGTASFGNSGSAQAALTLSGGVAVSFTGVAVGDNVKVVKNGTGDMVKTEQWRVGGTTGVEIVQNGGDAVFSSSQGEEVLGVGTAGPGTYTVNGGRLTVNNNSGSFSCWIGARSNGIGVMNVAGGEVTMNKTMIIGNYTAGASGTLNISGGSMEVQTGGLFMGNGSALGALNISTGGTLTIGDGSIWAGNSANAAVTLDGGTIKSGAANAAFFSNLANVTLGANGLTLETEYNLGFNNTVIATSGGKITKVGAGAVDLSGITVTVGAGVPRRAFNFAEAIAAEGGTAAAFTAPPAVGTSNWMAVLKDNGTRCRLIPKGAMIIVE